VKRVTRISAVLLAAGLVVPLWAVPAHAESLTETPASAAYFNRAGIAQPEGAPSAPPNLTASVDGVAPGNLAVAAQAGAEDKVSFLYYSLSTIPSGSVISKAVLTVPLVPNDNANIRLNASPKNVLACKINGSGFSSEDGAALSLAPTRDCTGFSVEAVQEGESYVFDITALAATWVDLNDGLALTRKEGGEANFQVVFNREASLSVEYTAPLEETTTTDTTTVDAGTTAAPTTTATDLGTSGGTGTTDLGGLSGGSFDTGTASTSLGGGFGAISAPVSSGALPAGAAPQTAGEEPVLAERVASGGPLGDSTPTAGFWFAGLLLAAVLALLSLIMGDPRAPSAVAQPSSRLSQALSARRRGAGTSLLGSPSA
jgi:hypothetical protein